MIAERSPVKLMWECGAVEQLATPDFSEIHPFNIKTPRFSHAGTRDSEAIRVHGPGLRGAKPLRDWTNRDSASSKIWGFLGVY
jgi:hypothetical protein